MVKVKNSAIKREAEKPTQRNLRRWKMNFSSKMLKLIHFQSKGAALIRIMGNNQIHIV